MKPYLWPCAIVDRYIILATLYSIIMLDLQRIQDFQKGGGGGLASDKYTKTVRIHIHVRNVPSPLYEVWRSPKVLT